MLCVCKNVHYLHYVAYRLPAVSYDWLACGTWQRNAHTVMSVNYDWRSVFLFFRNWKLS